MIWHVMLLPNLIVRLGVLMLCCLALTGCSVSPAKESTYYDPNPSGILLGSSQSVDVAGIFGNDSLEDAAVVDSVMAKLIAVGLLTELGETKLAHEIVERIREEDVALLQAMAERQRSRAENNKEPKSGRRTDQNASEPMDIERLLVKVDGTGYWSRQGSIGSSGELPSPLQSQIQAIEKASLKTSMTDDPRAIVARAMNAFDKAFEHADSAVAEPADSVTGIALTAGYLGVGRRHLQKAQAPSESRGAPDENLADLVDDLYMDLIEVIETSVGSSGSAIDPEDIDVESLAEFSEMLYENTGIDATPGSPDSKASNAMADISDAAKSSADAGSQLNTRELQLMRDQFEVAASDLANVEVTLYRKLLIALYSKMSTGNSPDDSVVIQDGDQTLAEVADTSSEAERLIDEEIRLMRE